MTICYIGSPLQLSSRNQPLVIKYHVLVSFACSWLFAFVTMVIGLYSMIFDLWCRMSLWGCARL